MSRNIRDLRDFINISRLSFRDSDDENNVSDSEDDEDEENRPNAVGSTFSENTGNCSSYDKSAESSDISKPCSPVTQVKLDEIVVGRPNSAVGMRRPQSAFSMGLTSRPIRSSSSRSHTPVTKDKPEEICSMRTKVDFLTKKLENFDVNNDVEGTGSSTSSNFNENVNKFARQVDNIEEIFCFVDASIINSWLERSNKQLDYIINWLEQNNNFLRLAHFLLTDFSPIQRKELLEMEVSIILDEIQLAFRVGIDSEKVKLKDLMRLLSIVLKEYPEKLSGKHGIRFVLDVLCIFCSGKNENFKKLLSNVKYSTENRQVAQWLLAIRAFSLIGLCNGILEFFKVVTRTGMANVSTNDTSNRTAMNRTHNWLFSSIELDYLDVLQYLLEKDPELSEVVDEQGRNLVFKAVVKDNDKILNFLLKKVVPKIDVNRCSNSGNAPLHAAIPRGNLAIIKMLIVHEANVNQRNEESQGATPLHLAVINGDLRIVKLLVENGADTKICMGNPATVTPAELAKDLENETIMQYLMNH